MNVYAHYRLSSRSSVSGRLRAATNTPLAGYYTELPDGRIFLGEERNRVRLPFYSRLDLRANRTFDVGRSRLTLHVEVVNVYNRRNERGARQPRLQPSHRRGPQCDGADVSDRPERGVHAGLLTSDRLRTTDLRADGKIVK